MLIIGLNRSGKIFAETLMSPKAIIVLKFEPEKEKSCWDTRRQASVSTVLIFKFHLT